MASIGSLRPCSGTASATLAVKAREIRVCGGGPNDETAAGGFHVRGRGSGVRGKLESAVAPPVSLMPFEVFGFAGSWSRLAADLLLRKTVGLHGLV